MHVTELSLSLPPVPSASRVARAAVRDRFAGALRPHTIADLELVVSELVTNGVEHGRGAIGLLIEHDGYDLNGSVTDRGTGFDYEPRTVDSHELHGRGLQIVEALVTRWGIRRGSTQVWFTITLVGGRGTGDPPSA